MKYTEGQIVRQITLNLSSDSSMSAKQNAGAAYANWFYANHNHGVENQRICISKIASVLGLNFDTAVRIQAPILAAYSAAYIIGIANEAIFSQHAQVSRQISSHLVDQAVQHAVQHAKEQKETKSAPRHVQYSDRHIEIMAAQQAGEAAQVAMENYRQQNKKNVTTAPRDQVIQPLLTVQSAQNKLAEMRQKVQAAYQAQVVQDQQAKKHLAPDKQALWNYMTEEHRGSITRNYAIVVKNHAIIENNIRLYEKLQQSAARELQLAQEDAETNIAAGTVTFRRSDIAKTAKSIEVAEKFHAFYTAEVREFCSMQNQNGLVVGSTARATKWDYVLRARRDFKVDVERYVAIQEDRLAHEGSAIEAIESFATAGKQWVLLNKPAAETEFDFFSNSFGWLPRANFATITKLNLSNSGMLDNNAYSLANTLTILLNLKYLDVSGNQITATGEGYFARVLQSPLVQNIIVTIKKYTTDLGQEVIKPALKLFIEHAKENGVDTTNIATNKNAFVYMNDIANIKSNFLIGFTKCETGYSYLENGVAVEDLAVEAALTYKAFRPLAPLVCIYEALDGAFVSPEGVDLVIKGLELLGDNE